MNQFRERHVRGALDEIYADTSPALWTTTTKDEFMQTMQLLTQRLGSWQSSIPTSSRVKSGIWMTTVSLSFLSKYDRGSAVEQFIWVIEDDRAKLAAYNFKVPGAKASGTD